jgi:hypothetical protein
MHVRNKCNRSIVFVVEEKKKGYRKEIERQRHCTVIMKRLERKRRSREPKRKVKGVSVTGAETMREGCWCLDSSVHTPVTDPKKTNFFFFYIPFFYFQAYIHLHFKFKALAHKTVRRNRLQVEYFCRQ